MEEQEQRGKSGQQVGAEYAERFRQYLDALRAKKQRLPVHNGKLNNTAIAVACAFPRLTLYQNTQVREMLDTAVKDKEIGIVNGNGSALPNTGGSETVPKGRAAHLEKLVGKQERRIGELEEIRASLVAENEELKRERKVLKEKLRQYEIMEEIMTTNGRRLRP